MECMDKEEELLLAWEGLDPLGTGAFIENLTPGEAAAAKPPEGRGLVFAS